MRSLPVALVSLTLGLGLLGCPKRVGSQSDLDATGREKVAEARRQTESGKPAEALRLLAEVGGESQAVCEAVFLVAEKQFTTGDFAGARSSYRDLLVRCPLFERADLAKRRLGIAQIELKEFRDALQTLAPLYPRLAAPKKNGGLNRGHGGT